MRLPRFTVRTLMVTVAIVALAFPLYRTIIFYKKYYNMAIFHSESEKYYALQLKNETFTKFAPSVSPDRQREMMAQSVARVRKRKQYHAEMKLKYERAATHPWDPLELDPPEPE